MSVQDVTLHLPETVLERAKQVAQALEQPLEEVLASMLTAVLPHEEDAPLDMQADLARMTWVSDQELWAIARSSMSDEDQEHLQNLAEIQDQRPLAEAEWETLAALRQAYGQVTLRKARAYALLSLRGGAPLLMEI